MTNIDHDAGGMAASRSDELGPLSDPNSELTPQALEQLISQLRTANENLVLATVNAQMMQEKAEATSQRQNEFLAMLAHELRNPLAPIGAAAAVLQRFASIDPLLTEIHSIISRQTEHMARLLDDLLDASRISSGKITLQRRSVSLSDVIERALELSRPFIDKRRQQLTTELPAEPLSIHGDLVRLAQVFSNLLINASKFTQEQGCISLMADLQADHIVVSVRDNGVGIAAEIQPHIFDLFVQGTHSLARTEGGLGIGLTVARALLEMHGGSISVESDGPGRGSVFRATLPVQRISEHLPAGPAAAGTPSAGCRILLIEDNVDANNTLKMLFELEGHSVRAAFDGITGLEMAKADSYEVIVCDIGLPGIDGLELAGHLRRQAGVVMPLLIAMSGYGQLEDRNRALDAGFDEYLVKPVESALLLRLIASQVSALRQAAGEQRAK